MPRIHSRAAFACAAALLGASCGRSCGGTPAGEGHDAAPPGLPDGATACGNPLARPKEVALEFLNASKARDLDGMLACFKPKHRETMAKRSSRLLELTVISFELGDETIDGESAQVAASVERYDGHGRVEHKHDPIRLDRVDGVWYFR